MDFKVGFLPFENGQPKGPEQEFLTGFIANNEKAAEVYGQPAGVAVLHDGSLLVADDVGNIIWRVSYTGGASAARPARSRRSE